MARVRFKLFPIMKPAKLTLTLASLLLTMNAEALSLLNSFNTADGARVGGAEIIAFTSDMSTLLSTVGDNTGGSFGVQVLTLGNDASLTERGFVDLSGTFGASANWNGASSVSVDPLGRGWGAVSLIPANNTGIAGKVAFFDYRSPAALVTLDVGFHPDSVRFSADGSKLFVVNEGEFNASVANPATTGNAPGSISIIDLSGISSLADVNGTNLTAGNVSTFDFSSGNLASGVTLAGIRNPSIAAVPTGTSGGSNSLVPDFNSAAVYNDADFFRGIEPEFVTQIGDKLHVSLQENNAIATFDLNTNKWTAVNSLGTITQTIDASDQDGGAFINDVVKGLPMPDTIASFSTGGTNYIISVNEGDARPDDGDVNRLGDTGGANSMNNVLDTTNVFPTTATGIRDNATGLGRLNVSRIDGDTGANGGIAGDGKIDEAIMIGTRSFSIWNADTGALVWDSGSLESVLLALDPTLHNNNQSASNFDARSDDKGPEPEALTVGQFGASTLAFVGLERQGGLLVYDITDPNNPVQVDYFSAGTNYAEGLVGPENLVYISAADSPTGAALLVGGYEITNGIGVYAVPEPSRALLGLVGVVLVGMRRRRSAR